MTTVTRLFLLLNIAVFLIELTLNHFGQWWLIEPFEFNCATRLPYQYLTYQFMHASLGHLYNNMIILYLFGPSCERILGKWRFLAYYLAFGVFGVWAQTFFSLPTDTIVGASAAIFGLLGFFTLADRTFIWIGGRKIMQAAIISFMIIAFEVPELFTNDKIGHAAHIGGAAAGAVAYFLYRKRIYR